MPEADASSIVFHSRLLAFTITSKQLSFRASLWNRSARLIRALCRREIISPNSCLVCSAPSHRSVGVCVWSAIHFCQSIPSSYAGKTGQAVAVGARAAAAFIRRFVARFNYARCTSDDVTKRDPDIPPGHMPPTFLLSGQFPSLVHRLQEIFAFHHQHPPVYNITF